MTTRLDFDFDLATLKWVYSARVALERSTTDIIFAFDNGRKLRVDDILPFFLSYCYPFLIAFFTPDTLHPHSIGLGIAFASHLL